MRVIRLDIEDREMEHLAKNASKSKESKGTMRQREADSIRTVYMQDRDRIIHSEYFRRLKDKAQVIMLACGDFRTRLTHTLEVMQIARTISRALRLNEDLTEAIALGHDLGHAPFGHAGESAIRKYYPKFHHASHSLRVVEYLEKGVGLNLTFEVRDGILKHTKGKNGKLISDSGMPATQEAIVVRISDSLAYINHDIDDAIRYGLLKKTDIPKDITDVLGLEYSQRVDNMVMGVIIESLKRGEVSIEKNVLTATNTLRNFMFERVYESKTILDDCQKVSNIVSVIFDYLLKNKNIIEEHKLYKGASSYKSDIEMVKDYVAYLTDTEANALYQTIKN